MSTFVALQASSPLQESADTFPATSMQLSTPLHEDSPIWRETYFASTSWAHVLSPLQLLSAMFKSLPKQALYPLLRRESIVILVTRETRQCFIDQTREHSVAHHELRPIFPVLNAHASSPWQASSLIVPELLMHPPLNELVSSKMHELLPMSPLLFWHWFGPKQLPSSMVPSFDSQLLLPQQDWTPTVPVVHEKYFHYYHSRNASSYHISYERKLTNCVKTAETPKATAWSCCTSDILACTLRKTSCDRRVRWLWKGWRCCWRCCRRIVCIWRRVQRLDTPMTI